MIEPIIPYLLGLNIHSLAMFEVLLGTKILTLQIMFFSPAGQFEDSLSRFSALLLSGILSVFLHDVEATREGGCFRAKGD